jgi:uncharacterized protein
MNLEERLRGVLRPGGSASQVPPDVSPGYVSPGRVPTGGSVSKTPPHASYPCAAEVLGGEWRESRGHRFLAVDRRYAVGHRLGRVSVGDCLPPADGFWPQLPLLMANAVHSDAARDRMLFVDLETTGLAGGAGTYAFLAGFGWFEHASFRVRQFLLTSYAVERGLLEEVAVLAAQAGALVTYNGKSFDVPLIETRFLFHRMPPPFSGVPHLDMLHNARRLWRPLVTSELRDQGDVRSQATCRLSAVEEAVLGHVREDDVPGFEVPSRYFHYVRTGDARPLEAVFEHNRLDVLALAMLAASAATLLEEGPDASRTAHEALGLGRLFERGGLANEARACFARAVRLGGSAATQAEALRAYAVSCRRARQFDVAANAWQTILALHDCPVHITKDATEALAVHHEHRLRDFHTARLFAMHSLQLTLNAARREAAQHRVARLDRKLGPPVVDSAPLFPLA